MFERIRDVDARCRAYHISADAAREALDHLPVPWWDDGANGWIFLRGSDSPQERTGHEVRKLLQLE
jgi:hypothetical protein